MSIAVLNTIPRDEDQWLVFSFHNLSEHRRIADAIQQQYNTTVPVLAIDPVPDDPADWLEQHQQMHSAASEVAGTIDYDFRDVDFTNLGDLQSWIQLHVEAHLELNRALGL